MASVPLTLTIAAAAPLAITTTSLDSGVQGTDYYASLQANGGVGNHTWSLASGALPAGLTLYAYGELYGTPSASGTYNFTVEVADSASPTSNVATVNLTLTIVDPSVFSILTQSLQPGVQGTYYYASLQANGGVGNDTWSLASGTLPAGLTLDAYGDLYGTPTSAGTSTFTVQVTDEASPTPDVASTQLTLTLSPAPALSLLTTSVPSGVQGALYSDQLSATGGIGPYTWTVASGSLPAGLTLDAAGGLSGYPTVAGSFAFDVQVTDSASPSPNVATAALGLTLSPGGPLTVTTTNLPPGVRGDSYDSSLMSTGGIGPFTWKVVSGALPAGLSLDPSGVLAGVMTGTGSTSFTVGVSDAVGDGAIGTISLVVTEGAPLQVSTVSLPPAVEGEDYPYQYLASSGGAGSTTWAVVSGALPAGMTLGANGAVSGTPTADGTFTFTASVTDSAKPVPNVASRTITLTVAPAQPLTIVPVNLPAGSEGSYYDAYFQSTGGVGPFTWSVASGSLPTGLTLASYGQYGYLDGSPTASGAFTFTLQVADSSSPVPSVATIPVTLEVGPPGPLQITTTTLPTGSQGLYYSAYAQATGGVGPYTWSVASGTLPAGLTLDPSGDISGTPTSPGTSAFTIEATDSASPTPSTASLPCTLVVGPPQPLQITTTAVTAGTEGVYYYSSLQATGGIGSDTWSVTSGTLPAGLTLQPIGSSVYLYGTPTVSGTFTFTAQVTDSASPTPDVASIPLTLTIAAPGPLQITQTNLPSGTQGASLDDQLQSTGGVGPYTWSLASGALPAGLALNANGDLSGYPTTAGSYTFTALVIDSASPTPDVVSAQFTLVITEAGPLQITTTGLNPGTQGSSYYDQLQATGGIGPYTWSVVSGSLPAGLTVESYGPYGYLTGTPTVSGTFSFTLEATDSAVPTPSVATTPLTMTVGVAPPLSILTTSLPSGTQGAQYDSYLQAGGGVGPYTWSVASGTLPAGLTLAPTGEISGYPTGSGTLTFTVRVTDSDPQTQDTTTGLVALTLNPDKPLAVTTASVLTGTQGVAYSDYLEASGGIGPYTWSVTSGSLPAGLTLVTSGQYGYLSGTPTVSGTFTFTATATDSESPTPVAASAPFTLTLGAAGPLLVTTTTLPSGQVGVAYGYTSFGYPGCYSTTLQAIGGIGPYAWSLAAGALPAGLTLDPGGELCGTPTASGTFSFTVEATDSATPTPATATAQLTLVIAPPTPFVITTASLPSAVQGVGYNAQLSSTGGTAPITWAVISGALPPGSASPPPVRSPGSLWPPARTRSRWTRPIRWWARRSLHRWRSPWS